MEITSANNTYIKFVASLKDARTRKLERKFILEGRVMLDAAVDAGLIPECIVCVESEMSNVYGANHVYMVAKSTFDKVSDMVAPQGILGVFVEPNRTCARPQGNGFILDNIRDPGNLGTIIRTAAALGVEDIYLIDCVDVYNQKVLRATMSGIFFVRCHACSYTDIMEFVQPVCDIVVADMGGINIFDSAKHTSAVALVVGNEAHGVGKELRAIADYTVALPMQHIESLNAAVSLSVIAYILLSKKKE